MWYPDLGTTCQIACGPRVRAVGWLSAEHPFAKGKVAPTVLDSLRVLAREGYCPVAMAGVHTCEFCSRVHESRNILVPGGELLFAAPAMIIHYIERHCYLPPQSFVDAVCECAAPPAAAYYHALRTFGSVWNYDDDVWNRLLDTEPAQLAALRAAMSDTREKRR
jgi:hypothetical protein